MYPKNEAIGDPIKYGSSSIIIIFSSPKSEFLKDDTVFNLFAKFHFVGFRRQNNVTVLRIVLKIAYICSHNRNFTFYIRQPEKVDGYANIAINLYQ